MHLIAIAIATLSVAPPIIDNHRATIFSLEGKPYTLIRNSKSCMHAPCVQYSAQDRVIGSFQTKDVLPANLKESDISSRLLRFSFTDGRTVITSANPTARKATFSVSTDAKGGLTGYDITVEQLASKPGAVPKRINAITMINAPGVKGELAFANVICVDEGPVPAEPKGRIACRGNKIDDASSRAEHGPPPPPILPMQIPPLLQAPAKAQPPAAPPPSSKTDTTPAAPR